MTGVSMERAVLKELPFKTRDEALAFLKKLWGQQGAACPICGGLLELLHRKAKKSACDWQCKSCDKVYKTIYLLDEINERFPE